MTESEPEPDLHTYRIETSRVIEIDVAGGMDETNLAVNVADELRGRIEPEEKLLHLEVDANEVDN